MKAHGLSVSLSVARPQTKRALAQLMRSLRGLCDTVIAPPRD